MGKVYNCLLYDNNKSILIQKKERKKETELKMERKLNDLASNKQSDGERIRDD